MGSRAFGFSSGFAVKVGKEEPGPHRMRACRPVAGIETACGIFKSFDSFSLLPDAIGCDPDIMILGARSLLTLVESCFNVGGASLTHLFVSTMLYVMAELEEYSKRATNLYEFGSGFI